MLCKQSKRCWEPNTQQPQRKQETKNTEKYQNIPKKYPNENQTKKKTLTDVKQRLKTNDKTNFFKSILLKM